MADAIFISYRRDDSEGEAGRLFDDLTRAFGSEAVFMDVAGIKPGVDFRSAIEQNVASCGVLLAVVGPTWISITNAEGTRRLDDPNDFVTLEIVSALKREVPVIPVLVHDAKMPAASLLPDSLRDLAFRNSVELSHARWNSDVSLLIEALKAYVNPMATPDERTVHATVPVQLPAPHPPNGSATPDEPSRVGLYAGSAVLAISVLCLIAWQVVPKLSSRSHRANASIGQAVAVSTPAVEGTGDSAVQQNGAADGALDPENANADLKTAFAGTWKRIGNPKNKTNIVELQITLRGKRLAIEATEADGDGWPQQPGQIKGGVLHAAFFFPGYPDTYALKIATAGPTQLSVTETATSPDGTHTNSDMFVCTRESLPGSR